MWDKALPENAVMAFIFTVIVASVRYIYDRDEIKPVRIFLEALLCGLLSLASTFAISAMGLDMHWAIFAGGFIGFIGADTTRALAIRTFKSKT